MILENILNIVTGDIVNSFVIHKVWLLIKLISSHLI